MTDNYFKTLLEHSINKIATKCKNTYAKLSHGLSSIIVDPQKNQITFTMADNTTKTIDLPQSGTGDANIDDNIISSETVFSSAKVDASYLNKTDASNLYQTKANSHSHNDLATLESITSQKISSWDNNIIALNEITLEFNDLDTLIKRNGDGNSLLTDNGNYVAITDITNYINDSDTNSTITTISSSKINKVVDDKIKTSENSTDVKIDSAKTTLSNTFNLSLDKKVNKVDGMGLSTNDFTTRDKTRLEMLTFEGEGKKALFDDGFYYSVTNAGIDDSSSHSNMTYSSEKIDNLISREINNLVLPTQDDSPTMWQKTFEDVSSGDQLEMTTTEDFTVSKVIVQAYKYMNGETGLSKTLYTFNSDDADKFYYDSNNIEFSNTLKFKDKFLLTNTLNSDGFYETETIRKSDYVDFNSIAVEEKVTV